MSIKRRDVDRMYDALRPRLGRRAGTVGGSTILTIPPHTHSADQIGFTPCDSGRVASTNVQDAICEVDAEKLAIDGTMVMTGHLQMGHQDIVDALNLEVEVDATVGQDLTVTRDVSVGRNQTFIGGVGAAILSGVRRITMAGIGIIEAIRTADFTGSAVGEGIINKPRVIHMDGDDSDNEARIDGVERILFNDEPTKSVIQRPSVIEFNLGVEAGVSTTPKRGQWLFDKKERLLVTYFESVDNLGSALHKVPFGWTVLQCVRGENGGSHMAAGTVVKTTGDFVDYDTFGERLPKVDPYGSSDAAPNLTEAHAVCGITLGRADRDELVPVMVRGRWHTASGGWTAGDLLWASGSGLTNTEPTTGVRIFIGTVIFDDTVDAIVDINVRTFPSLGEGSFVNTVTPSSGFVPVFHTGDGQWNPELLAAAFVTYDNATSGIPSTDVQAALDLLAQHEGHGFTVLSPGGATDVVIWRAPYACTVTNVRGYRNGGTGATVNARKNATSEHLSSDLSLSSADTWMDGGAVQNTGYAAGDSLEVRVKSVSGSPVQVVVQVDFVRA